MRPGIIKFAWIASLEARVAPPAPLEGARVSGLPKVSTACPDAEFYPGDQSTDTMYSSFEGAIGGNRVHTAFPDDDADGAVDEDPLDGLDNDGDGRVDEDFGAIGNQMLRCRYRDDYPRTLWTPPTTTPWASR